MSDAVVHLPRNRLVAEVYSINLDYYKVSDPLFYSSPLSFVSPDILPFQCPLGIKSVGVESRNKCVDVESRNKCVGVESRNKAVDVESRNKAVGAESRIENSTVGAVGVESRNKSVDKLSFAGIPVHEYMSMHRKRTSGPFCFFSPSSSCSICREPGTGQHCGEDIIPLRTGQTPQRLMSRGPDSNGLGSCFRLGSNCK